jgi:hypothetical protein
MAQEPHLDDRYTTGVYYDRHAGEYCEIVELDDTIGLCEPGRDEPYYTYDEEGYTKEEAIKSVNRDMSQISEEAVENPVHVVERALRRQQRNSINELASVPEQEATDLGYAREQVEIVEKT